jgi:hypothetical protein
MPVITVPFNEFLPDQGYYGNPGLVHADNVAPIGATGFAPMRKRTLSTSAPGRTTTGCYLAGVGLLPKSPPEIFTGDRVTAGTGKLYRWTYGSNVWTGADVTRTSGGDYTVQTEGWYFLAYGNDMLAVCGNGDEPQRFVSGAANFTKMADPTGVNLDPRSKYIGVIGLHILLANCYESAVTYPNRVWWSGTDDPSTFGLATTHPSQRTGYQDLNDEYGEITGCVGGADYAYVFKRQAIYRMDWGGPFDYQFTPFAVGRGTVWPRSIARLGDEVYYWSDVGPTVIRGTQAMPIGLEKFSRALQDRDWYLPRSLAPNLSHPAHLLWATADPANDLVIWGFNSLNHAEASLIDYVDTLFIYNARYDRGSIVLNFDTRPSHDETVIDDGDVEVTGDGTITPNATRPCMAVASYGDINSNAVIRAWAPLSKVLWVDVLRIGETNGWKHHVGQVAPDYYSTPRFQTGFSPLDEAGGDTHITRVRPIFSVPDSSTEVPVVTVIHRWIRRPGEKPSTDIGRSTYTSNITRSDRGWINLTSSQDAPYHSIEVQFTTPISEISAIEIEYAGKGGKAR